MSDENANEKLNANANENLNANANATVTQTTTTSGPNEIKFHSEYLKTAPGLLKIAQLVMKHTFRNQKTFEIIKSRHFSL